MNKERKNEINEEFKEADYIGRKVGIRVAFIIIVICIIGGIGGKIYKEWSVGKDREIFKQSVTYNESAATFLADSYKQYNEAQTKDEKEAIKNYVIMRYPDLDLSNIDNTKLKAFYNECQQ